MADANVAIMEAVGLLSTALQWFTFSSLSPAKRLLLGQTRIVNCRPGRKKNVLLQLGRSIAQQRGWK